jgi:hypothetical protein
MKKKHLLHLAIFGCLIVMSFYWNSFFDSMAYSTLRGYSKEPSENVVKLLSRSDFIASLLFDRPRRNAILKEHAIIRYKIYYCDGKLELADLEYTKIMNYVEIGRSFDTPSNSLRQNQVVVPKNVCIENILDLANAFEEGDKRYLFNISPEGLKQQKEKEETVKEIIKELKKR